MGQHAAPRLCRGIAFFRFASVLLPVCVLGLRVQRVLSGVEGESNMNLVYCLVGKHVICQIPRTQPQIN